MVPWGRRVFAAISTVLVGAGALVAGVVGTGSLDGRHAPDLTTVSDHNVRTKTLATWNMQGGSDSVNSKWTTGVAELARQNTIVALQEAGPDLPATTTHVTERNIGGFTVREGLWPIDSDRSHGNEFAYVYFLPIDTNGHRVNLAMVTQQQADDVVIIPPITRDEENRQPEPPNEDQAPANDRTDNVATATNRPMLGLVFGDTVYYDIHARARSRGRDAPEMITRAAQGAVQAARDWVILGDFNRSPASMNRDMPEADQSTHSGPRPIGNTYDADGATHMGGGNLDYMVTNRNLGGTDDYIARRQTGRGSDHLPVAFGAPLARQAAEFTLTSGDGALDVENGTVGLGQANGDLGTMYYPTGFDYMSGSAGFVSKRDGNCLANKDGTLTEEPCDKDDVEQDFTFDKADSSGPYDFNVRSIADDRCLTPALVVQTPPYRNLTFGNCDRSKFWTYRRQQHDPTDGAARSVEQDADKTERKVAESDDDRRAAGDKAVEQLAPAQ